MEREGTPNGPPRRASATVEAFAVDVLVRVADAVTFDVVVVDGVAAAAFSAMDLLHLLETNERTMLPERLHDRRRRRAVCT